MNKYKISTITLSITTLILFTTSVTLGVLLNKKQTPKRFDQNDYYYFKISDYDNYIWEKNPILFSTDAKYTKGTDHSIMFDNIDPIEGSTKYFRSPEIAQGSPIYENSELIGFIGNDTTGDVDYKGVDVSDFNGNKKRVSNKIGDHEFYSYGNQIMYLGIGNNENEILYVEDYKKETPLTIYDTRAILGLPEAGSNTYLNNSDELHFNSFDIWEDDLIINSRSFSTIFALHLFENGKILPQDEVELDWLLPNDPTAIYFIDEDNEGDFPINIVNGNAERNPEYTPHINRSYTNKIINPYYNDKSYDLQTEEGAKEYHKTPADDKFFGAHRVSVLNKLLEKNNFLDMQYNEDLIYLSIHDNHFAGNINNNFYSIWSDNPSNINENGKRSMTKILAINPKDRQVQDIPPMSYKLLLNFDNSTLSTNDMYSAVCSSSLFFSIKEKNDYHNYLSTNSAAGSSTQLIEFESIDSNTRNLKNPELVYEIKWLNSGFDYLYRSYPIFQNLNVASWGWNLMELKK